MDPPSAGSGGGGGGGAGASSASPRSSSINQMAYCHECGIEIRPLMTPDPTCPRCNGQFVEIIDQNSAGHFGDDDQDDDVDNPFALPGSDPFSGFAFRTGSVQGGASLPQTLNSLLAAMASGAAPGSTAGARRGPNSPGSSNQQSNRNNASGRDQQGSSTTARSGSTSFGPFGLQWNVQYGSGGGDPYRDHYRRATEQPTEEQRRHHDLEAPPTLSNFLRFAFGGAESTDENATHRQQDTYFHDDGMGGAGGVADGRHFNHDNRGTYHQPPQSPNNDTTGRTTGSQGGRGGTNNDLPPELGALRNLFTGLFGDPGTQGGSLLDLLAAGAQGGAGGPRGQWGDYVLGQQGLDDIISQLMEQTQGSTAPPPATEDVIEKLERFTLNDKQRIEKAKNQDCPTCKDDFLPSQVEASEAQKEEEEEVKKREEDEEQQQDLISMPCGHIFHVDCLVPWLRLHGTCPVCRISIAKPREEDSSNNDNENRSAGQQSQTTSAANLAPIPGGWPSPPNPFTSLFSNVGQGAQIPRDSPDATTTTYHPQPRASTTVTSTVYPTPPAVASTVSSGAGGEVVNSIVSSPPIVSDREEYFADAQGQPASREDMRETVRRAAEGRNGGGGDTGRGQFSLEPDELD
ncbi:uncharacterized protein SPSC_05312 [Sporisorium scitamineum]|uniref:RING-type E3 ubiquitin transferase n=1 Tax=Sporisorium scitamineum TaxID=49012 RepID=A0A127ZH39_9BASI|nr:uncharacterized protein SPSC_05312 [Sporisorium scitamineum]